MEKIEYRQCMLDMGMKPKDLPVRVWRGDEIPVDVRGAVNAEGLLNLGGVYGDKNAGDPVEYFVEGLTIQDFERLYPDINRRSLQRDLKVMVDMGLLVSEGATNKLVYRMKETG